MASARNSQDRTLGELVAGFEAQGYRGQMAARPEAMVMCFTCRRQTDATEIEVEGLERMEGASDPADMVAVIALTCPNCSTPGTLVLSYGPDSNQDDADVLMKLGLDG